MKQVKISDKIHKRIKKLCKGQGVTITDIVETAVCICVSALEENVSMQPDKK